MVFSPCFAPVALNVTSPEDILMMDENLMRSLARRAAMMSLVAPLIFVLMAHADDKQVRTVKGTVTEGHLEVAFDDNMEPLPEEQRKTLVTFGDGIAYIVDYDKRLPVVLKGCKVALQADFNELPIYSLNIGVESGIEFRKKYPAKLLEISDCPSPLDGAEITVRDESGKVIRTFKHGDVTNESIGDQPAARVNSNDS